MTQELQPQPGSLDGIRVIDLTTFISGPYCTMLLADAGASVIKVERPDGDEMRRVGPFVGQDSAPFAQLNRNKRSICLDLKSAGDLAALKQLIIATDVLVENFRPGVADKLGIGYTAMRALNPRLIYCSISGYGQTGPYRSFGGFDLMAQSMSGLMTINAGENGEPRRLPIPISDICAGMFGALGITCALNARHTSGQGQHIDLSLLEAAVAMGVYEAASFFSTGQRPAAIGQRHRGSAPYQAFRASDGWLTLGAGPQNLWQKLCAILELPALLTDVRFQDAPSRLANVEALVPLIQARIEQRPRDQWVGEMQAAGIPAAPVLGYDEVFADPQVLHRQMVAVLNQPYGGQTRVVGPVAKLSITPSRVRTPPPRLGEHNEEIRRAFGLPPAAG